MKFHSIVAAVASLLTSTLADTLRYPFTLTAMADHTKLPFHMSLVNAANGVFVLDEPPNTSCNLQPQSACPPGTQTDFILYNDGTMGLDVKVPNGQRVYLSSVIDDGVLRFETAGSTNPPLAIYDHFTVTGGFPSYLQYYGQDFYACSLDSTRGTYFLYVEYQKGGILAGRGCSHLKVQVQVQPPGPTAYEYE